MKIAYFDTFAGIAGDMALGAFISAGLDANYLQQEIEKLNLGDVHLEVRKVVRSGITAAKVDVVVHGEIETVKDLGSDHHAHGHSRAGSHHDHGHGKSYLEIKHLIEGSRLTDAVKAKSIAVFGKLAEAEAKIHDTTVEKIHFHEVGAVDSIVDIVGAVICMELTGVERLYTSPIRVGSNGYIEAQHGVLPVPAPATLEILKGYPILFNDVSHELTTPTGAAIVSALSAGVLKEQAIEVESIGYGAGSREMERLPNLLRVVIGTIGSKTEEDHVLLVEANMDDINPQLIPYTIEKVLEAGATDAYVTPVLMKKGRPGFLLSVLTSESKLEGVTAVIYRESTTLGMRIQAIRRSKAHRELRTAETSFGTVQVKESVIEGKVRVAAEFEECRRIAEEKGLPLPDVMRKINAELNRE